MSDGEGRQVFHDQRGLWVTLHIHERLRRVDPLHDLVELPFRRKYVQNAQRNRALAKSARF